MRILSLAIFAVSLLANGIAAQDDVAKRARLIDRRIEAKLAELKLQPAPRADDAEFARRVSLDITGRILSADRVRAFLEDADPDKRTKLIDELLASPSHGRYHAYLWRDLIAKRDDIARSVDPTAFVDWLANRLNANDGWDKIVTAMITARGSFEFKGQKFLSSVPELYLIRTQLDNNKEPAPNKMASVVGNLFLGVQIQCAECHRHPSNRQWTRDDFWGLSAFFGKLRQLDSEGKAPDPTVKGNPKITMYGEADEIKIRVRAPGKKESVRFLPRGAAIEVPNKVDEFEVDRIAKGRFLGGPEPDLGEKGPFRPAFASWLTAKDNPFFAKAAVNRLWGQLFGRGFVNPLDDFQPDNEVSHPELLDELAKDFAASGYDRKRLIRIVCNSGAYQRTSRKIDSAEKLQPLFGARKVRIMTADQLLDSLAVARGLNPDTVAGDVKDGNKGSNERPLGAFNITALEDDPSDYNYGVPQALKLMNARLTSTAVAKTLEKMPRAQALERLYLTAFARMPTADDVRLVEGFLSKSNTGFDGLMFALLNSAEFCSVR